jgi:hypothetical protein
MKFNLWMLCVVSILVVTMALPARGQGGRGGGFGGGEIFLFAENEAIQQELGLSPEAAAKAKTIHNQYRETLLMAMPAQGLLTQVVIQDDGSIRAVQEATPAGIDTLRTVTATFRPQLKEVLTADQYRRLRQITWQAMGTAAYSDDEVIESLTITKEQQVKISAIVDEFNTKRREVRGVAFDRGRVNAAMFTDEIRKKENELNNEQDARINDSLTKAQLDQFAEMKGDEIEVSLLRGRFDVSPLLAPRRRTGRAGRRDLTQPRPQPDGQ